MEAVVNSNWNEVKGTKTIVFNSVEMRTTQCIGNFRNNIGDVLVGVGARRKQFVKNKSR